MKVIVLINDSKTEEENFFMTSSTKNFLAGYDDLDSIYDTL
jgi:hypothetical protein